MKILIIQQKMIGDVLTSSILFEAIRELYPEANLHYLIHKHTFAVVENNPMIDKVIFDQQDPKGNTISLRQFANQIKKEKYTYILDVYSKLGTAYLCLCSNAQTIGYRKWYSQWAYSQSIKVLRKPNSSAGLAIENRLRLLEIFPDSFNKTVKPKIYLSKEEVNKAQIFLEDNAIQLNKPILMIGLLGSAPNKTYPLNYLAQLLELVTQKMPNAQLLLNYLPSQKKEVKNFLEFCSDDLKVNIHHKIYAENLREFIALLSFSKALIGNEGGSVNMAKALGVPTFSIFSPWVSKEAWALFSDERNVGVHLKDFKPQHFDVKNAKKIKKHTNDLYCHFEPKYIIPQFGDFLSTIS